MRPIRCAIMAGFVTFIVPAIAAAPAVAQDFDPLSPVREIMDLTVVNWSENVEEWKGIFEGDRLDRLYTRDLADLYRKASEKAAKVFESDEPVDPFDYDVVTNSQDGCPLEDVKIALSGEKDGVYDVMANFRIWACEDNPDTKSLVSEVHFDVVEQNGKPVIRDIHHVVDGERDSVLEEMKTILTAD